ncbi:DUF4365 domain-containing protein [Aquabacterium fontiphilum]|uniref:DUF4365 domain-containing protein n=1 Tax=Aquabacterium fontiphilum TaxID=450365 RepID=UPI001377CE3E|nr:DUF4365 and DUF1817 domain-containing protein [Aquabacterium fontiphilum]NBD19807.1 DUF4365 domain-containing protein [Aquabacterium fontiphilum]
MSTGFPSYSNSAKKGENGVNVVSRVFNEVFGWIFKRNHQEHDFGIDGLVDVVLDDGTVTGQMLAVQIKFGKSFFQEKNPWGYIYRGELKHFNYLSNYPVPVLIVICHPSSGECYWARFEPNQCQKTESGWKATIPFENKLEASKPLINAILPPVKDSLSELEEYWATNNVLQESAFIVFVIDRPQIVIQDTQSARSFFDRLRTTKELAYSSQGKVEISFHGYDKDVRELFEIEEVRRYIPILARALPELFFFARTDPSSHTLKTFALCQTKVWWPNGRSTLTERKRLEYETKPVAEFMMRHWQGLNEMTEWLSMPIEENRRISEEIFANLGFDSGEEGNLDE